MAFFGNMGRAGEKKTPFVIIKCILWKGFCENIGNHIVGSTIGDTYDTSFG